MVTEPAISEPDHVCLSVVFRKVLGKLNCFLKQHYSMVPPQTRLLQDTYKRRIIFQQGYFTDYASFMDYLTFNYLNQSYLDRFCDKSPYYYTVMSSIY